MPINRIAHSSTEIDIENYISILRTGQLVSDTGWRTYVNTAGVNPVTGIGGTAGITWSQNTTDVLNGESDLRLVKNNSNRQGEGVSIDFTIDNRHLAKVLQISFDTELISTNGTYLNPISSPVSGLANASNSTTCTITANNSLQNGQSVFVTFASNPPVNNYYTVSSVTSTSFVITLASAATLSNAVCNYTAISDLRVSIIQDPNGTPVVIEPVNTGISLGISNPRQRIRHIATFQTHISLRTYRLCIHVANASTVAYTVDFANFRVWEPTQSVGSVITDWQEYTPSFNTNVSFKSGRWRRVGGFAEVQVALTLSGAFAGINESNILPPGIIIDSNKLPLFRTSFWFLGNGAWNDTGIADVSQYVCLQDNRNIVFFGGGQGAGNGDSLTFQIRFPVVGWGSSVAMSSDMGDSRLVAFSTSGTMSISNGQGITFKSFPSIAYDTHGTWNNTTGLYTAPVSGVYNVNVQYTYHTFDTSQRTVGLYKNGTFFRHLFDTSSAAGNAGSTDVQCNAGETLSIAFNSSAGGNAVCQGITIKRIPAGSQVIATSETVAVSYFRSSTGNTIAGGSRITFNQRLYDTHGAVTGTASVNDNNWKFTAPMAGKYRIGGMLIGSSVNLHVQLWKNDSLFYATVAYLDSMSVTPISYTIDLLAGEFIDLRPSGSVPIGGGTLATSGTSSIVIERIGV